MDNLKYAKKMVVVPQELIERLRNENQTESPTPPAKQMRTAAGGNSLDAEMHRILEDKTLDDNEKWKQYQQILQRFLHFSAQKRKPVSMPVLEEDDSEQDIVQSFPVTYQKDVRNLLRFIKRNRQVITWDPDGTVIVRDVKIPGSNIVDVLHGIVRVRRLDSPPLGWAEVLNVLDELNVPTEYISNVQARQFLGREPHLEEGLVTPPPSVLSFRRHTSPQRRRRGESGFPLTPPPSLTPLSRRRIQPPPQVYDSPSSSESPSPIAHRLRSSAVAAPQSRAHRRSKGPLKWERFTVE